MQDGGPGRTKTGQRVQTVTFRKRQSGFELRIEKPNSQPLLDIHVWLRLFLSSADSFIQCNEGSIVELCFFSCQICA